MFRALVPPSPPPTAAASSSSSSSSSLRSRPTFCSATTCTPPPLATEARGSKGRSASLYEVLRVNHTATITEIKAAYRSLAKVYHPDAGSSAKEEAERGREFMEIHEAYATLSDPAARAVYDLRLGLGGMMRRRGRTTTRRWETDQCW